MHRNPSIPFVFICLALITGACYTSRLTLTVLQPAKTALPSSLRRISILPMTGIPSAAGEFDSLKFLKPAVDAELIKMGYLHGFNGIVSASPRFTKAVFTDTATASFLKKRRLFWDDLISVCKHDTTDAVLVLTRAVTYDFYPPNANIPQTNQDFRLINKTRWIFYQPDNQKIAARYDFSDTVLLTAVLDLAEVENLLYDACFQTGEQCGRHLVPYWQDVSRILFIGPGKDLKDAADFTLKERWYNAGMLWNDLIGNRNTKTASKAAFNLAVAFERDDDLDQAYLWVAYADSLHSNELTSLYKKILELRLKNKPVIDQQMSGN